VYGAYMGVYYRIATIAMLIGTGELLLSMKMNGDPQFDMILFTIMFYFMAGCCYVFDRDENQYNYIHRLEKYS